MNYYQPLQRENDKRWDFTRNGVPVGYCRGDGGGEKYHCDGHVTREEAIECYRQYQLDNDVKARGGDNTGNQLRRCRECQTHTDGYVEIGHAALICLCKDHQTREVYEKYFEGAGLISSSW